MNTNRLARSVMFALISVVGVLLAAPPALGQGAVVKDNYIRYNGIRYFKANSEALTLGCYGEKKEPVTKANYLEVQSHIPFEKLKVKTAVIVDIDFKQTSEKDFKANVVASSVGGNVNTAYDRLDKGELKLVKFEVELVAMKNAVNDSPRALNNLESYGNDARICHQVFVVLEATTATEIASSTTLGVTVTNGSLVVTGKGKAGSTKDTTVTLSTGSVYAYLLCKIDWEKNGKKVEKLTDDQHGLN